MGNFIVYTPSGKCYVGITSQAPECRWGNDGCKYLEIHKNGKLKHPYFAQAILKYGWDNIKHELLHEKLSKEEACKLEQKYIAEYKSQSLSYNITDGGEGILIATYFGVREASRCTGINGSHIGDCCNHKPNRKTAGGFKWEWQ
jgi:hypothetical protein|nr:MAG TPA: intron associated endonuclease [Crassvirales sp.]